MLLKRTSIALAAILIFIGGPLCRAQNGNAPAKPLTVDEQIAKQVDDLIDRYKLDDYQAFRIDTLLQHYVPVYHAAMQKVKDSGAAQVESYQMVLDYWADFFDTQYQQIFNEDQWKLYLKSAAGREKKKRDKRLEAARQGKQ
jgi:hypothetical protein